MSDRGLGKTFLTETAWLSLSQMYSKATNLVRVLIIAALISRDDMGLFGIAVLLLDFLAIMGQSGLITSALVQRAGGIGQYLGTAWVTQVIRGFVIAAAVYFAAPWMEQFFEKQGIASVMLVLALAPILGNLKNIGLIHLERELRFRPLAALEATRATVECLASVLIAIYYPTVWCLVWGRIAGIVVQTTLSYLIVPPAIAWDFKWSQFKELCGFGMWVVFTALLAFTLTHGGGLMVGKLLPLSAMAIYTIAYQFGCSPTAELCRSVTRVSFSTFSRIQHDPVRLSSAYMSVYAITCIWVGFMVCMASAVGQDATYLLLKPSYAEVAQILPLLSIWGANRALAENDSMLFSGSGRPWITTIFQLLVLVLFGVVVVPATMQFGLWGVATGLAAVGGISQLLRMVVVWRLFPVHFTSLVGRLGGVALAAVVGVWAAHGLTAVVHWEPSWVRFCVRSVVAAAVYGATVIALDTLLGYHTCRNVIALIQRPARTA